MQKDMSSQRYIYMYVYVFVYTHVYMPICLHACICIGMLVHDRGIDVYTFKIVHLFSC